MLINRRRLIGAAVATMPAAMFAAGAEPALDKPVRIIVGYAAGSGLDSVARYLAEVISKRSGQSAVVINAPGADGNIGASNAVRAGSDMYTLLVSGASTHAANASIYRKLPFSPESDFTPLSVLGSIPFVLLVNPERIKARSIGEFLSWAKAGTGQSLTFASSSVGNRVAGEQFRRLANLNAVNVPYKASSAAMIDLLGGRVDFYFCDSATAIPQIKARKAVALVVSVKDRIPDLPDVPTLAEVGFEDFDIASWMGLWSVTASTPPGVSAQLAKWVIAVLESAEGRAFLMGKGYILMPAGPEYLANLQARDTAVWGRIIRANGMVQP